MLASGAASAEGPTPLHLHCPFTSRLVCRCIYGTRTRLAANFEQASDGTGGAAAANGQRRDVPAAASDVMARARAAWRLLHHADASQDDPVVVMLPKLVRHGPPARVPGTAGAAARLEAAEAAALAAVRMAASMAAAAGLPYRPPDGVALDGLEGIVQADHSELERQVQAVHTAQETRQAAATRAAAAAAAAAGASLPEATPSVMPLSAFMAADAAEGAVSPGVRMRRSRSLEAAPPVEAGQLQHAHSLPSPSSASGASGGALARRRSGGKPPAKLSSGAGRAGPGKGGKGKQGAVAAARRAAADRPGAGAEPAPPPNLAPSGDGYQPHGPSTATPPMAWLLKAQDLSAALQGRLVQVPEGAACSGNGGSRKRGASAGDPPAANPAAAGGGGHAKRQRLDVGLYDGMLDLPSAAAAATEAPLLALPFGGGISDDLLLSPSAGFKEDGEMQEEQALGWRSQSGDELLLPEGPEALLAAHEGMPGGSESDAALLALAPPSSSLGGAFGSGSGSLRFASLHGSGSGSGNLVNTSGVANEQLQPAIHPPEQPVQAVLTAAVAAPPADEPADEPAGKPAAANKPAAAEEPVSEPACKPAAADGPAAAEEPGAAGELVPAAEPAGDPTDKPGPAEDVAAAAEEPPAPAEPAAGEAAEPAAVEAAVPSVQPPGGEGQQHEGCAVLGERAAATASAAAEEQQEAAAAALQPGVEVGLPPPAQQHAGDALPSEPYAKEQQAAEGSPPA